MQNDKKLYELNDLEQPQKIEKKHLYNDIIGLNKYFYTCYSNANVVFRNSYGNIIINKLSSLLTIINKIYFSNFTIDDISQMYLLVKDIEFHIKLFNNTAFSKSQIVNISKLLGNLSLHIKLFKADNELCE